MTQQPTDIDPLASKHQRIAKVDDPGSGPVDGMASLAVRIVIGVFDQRQQAEAARQALTQHGFAADTISLALQPAGTAPEVSADETKSGEGIALGATSGALVGGALGLVALSIPGLGPLLAAGPLVTLLSSATLGGVFGGLIGSFAGLGVPTERAQAYEAAIRAGGVVLSVRAADADAATRAETLLRNNNARDVSSYQDVL